MVDGGELLVEVDQSERAGKLHVSLRLVLLEERERRGNIAGHAHAISPPEQREDVFVLPAQNRVTD